MRVLISTFGTRGDIQPAIALGKGVIAAGHEASVCTAEGYRRFVEEYDVPFSSLRNDVLQLTQEAVERVSGLGGAIRTGQRMRPAIRASLDDEWQAAEAFRPDVIVYHPKTLGSLHVAEKLGIPAIMALPLPFYTPTADFPIPFLSGVELGGRVNRLTYSFQRLAPVMYGGMINDFRAKALDLPPIGRFADPLRGADGSLVPILYSFSRHVLPVPADYPPHVHVTGYWFLDRPADWTPDPALVDFLDAGPPPVYVGFGSMVGGPDAGERAALVLEALARTGRRGILASGWGGLRPTDLPPDVFMVESVPHDWLLPRVAAVVHHGGAGTTAAGLRAGKPTLICPFLADQPFWGKSVLWLGAGPAPLPLRKLTAEQLAGGIARLTEHPGYASRASAIGDRIRGEDGVARAIEIITAIGAGRPVPAPHAPSRLAPVAAR